MSAFARHIPKGGQWQLVALHLRSRNLSPGLAAIVVVSGFWLVFRRWASFDPAGGWGDAEVLKQYALLQAVPALLAGIVGVAMWSPFGETERTAGTWLPRLRAIHLGGLLLPAMALSVALAATWPGRDPDVDLALVAARNLLGFTGMGLLAGRVVDARLSWIAPLAWAFVAALNPSRAEGAVPWQPAAWLWSGLPDDRVVSWAVALGLFAVGAGVFLRWGPKDAEGDDA